MLKLLSLSLAAASVMFAAAPNIGDVVRETTPPKDITPITEPLIEITGAQYAPAMKEDKSGKTIPVKRFKIKGARHMEEEKLQQLILPYIGRELTFAQLQEAASIITKAYRKAGYFVARAYIPVQAMQEGVLEIAIIEGNYGDFKLYNTSPVKDSNIQAILDHIKDENIVSTDTLERAMLIINDTPGIKVTQADVMPGTLMGTSDFAIKTESAGQVDGYIAGDNYGSRYTGKNRLMAGVNLNSLAGIGDRLALNGMITSDSDLRYGKLAYTLPLMPNGLRGELSYSTVDYHLSDRYASMDAYGKARSVEASLSYPLIRTRAETLRLICGIASKEMSDYQSNMLITDKEVRAFTIGVTHTKLHPLFGFNTQTKAGVTLTAGKLTFIDEASRAADAAGVNTQGRYNKINGYAGAAVALASMTSLETTLSFQKSFKDKNLDGSEDFSIGGNTGVKAYPYSELSAENGMMLNTELLRTLSPIYGIRQKAALFHDIGKVNMADSSTTATFRSRTLQDIGIGYYASYDGLFAKAQFSRLLGGGHVTSEPDYKNKFLVQLGWSF